MVELASDFLDRSTPVFRDDVCFFISQSGKSDQLWSELKSSILLLWDLGSFLCHSYLIWIIFSARTLNICEMALSKNQKDLHLIHICCVKYKVHMYWQSMAEKAQVSVNSSMCLYVNKALWKALSCVGRENQTFYAVRNFNQVIYVCRIKLKLCMQCSRRWCLICENVAIIW